MKKNKKNKNKKNKNKKNMKNMNKKNNMNIDAKMVGLFLELFDVLVEEPERYDRLNKRIGNDYKDMMRRMNGSHPRKDSIALALAIVSTMVGAATSLDYLSDNAEDALLSDIYCLCPGVPKLYCLFEKSYKPTSDLESVVMIMFREAAKKLIEDTHFIEHDLEQIKSSYEETMLRLDSAEPRMNHIVSAMAGVTMISSVACELGFICSKSFNFVKSSIAVTGEEACKCKVID